MTCLGIQQERYLCSWYPQSSQPADSVGAAYFNSCCFCWSLTSGFFTQFPALFGQCLYVFIIYKWLVCLGIIPPRFTVQVWVGSHQSPRVPLVKAAQPCYPRYHKRDGHKVQLSQITTLISLITTLNIPHQLPHELYHLSQMPLGHVHNESPLTLRDAGDRNQSWWWYGAPCRIQCLFYCLQIKKSKHTIHGMFSRQKHLG